MKSVQLGETTYFHFAVNDTAGSGNDGASTAFDVRLAGDTSSAIPILSGSATLLSHANYPPGAYEIAIAATGGNGFDYENEYAVFCTLLVDSQNPTGYVGSFRIPAAVGSVTSHFSARTTDGYSTVQTCSGEYILHVSGTFAGATVTLWGGLNDQDVAEFLELRSFDTEQKKKLTYAGDIRFEVSGATGSTSINAVVQNIVPV
jgi:hypothetical protein